MYFYKKSKVDVYKEKFYVRWKGNDFFYLK